VGTVSAVKSAQTRRDAIDFADERGNRSLEVLRHQRSDRAIATLYRGSTVKSPAISARTRAHVFSPPVTNIYTCIHTIHRKTLSIGQIEKIDFY